MAQADAGRADGDPQTRRHLEAALTRTPNPAELDAIERAGAALEALGHCSHHVALCSLGIAVSALLNALPEAERDEIAERWVAVLAHSLGWEIEAVYATRH